MKPLTLKQLDEIEARHKPTDIPCCRVCGDALSISSMGGGNPTSWGCDGWSDETDKKGRLIAKPGRKPYSKEDQEHYGKSIFVDRRHVDDNVPTLCHSYREAVRLLERGREISLHGLSLGAHPFTSKAGHDGEGDVKVIAEWRAEARAFLDAVKGE